MNCEELPSLRKYKTTNFYTFNNPSEVLNRLKASLDKGLSGGDSGIRTPDLRIMMKIASTFLNQINELVTPKHAV